MNKVKTTLGELNFPDTDTLLDDDRIAVLASVASAHVAVIVCELLEGVLDLVPADQRGTLRQTFFEMLNERADGCPCEAWADPRENMFSWRCDCGAENLTSEYDLITGLAGSCGTAPETSGGVPPKHVGESSIIQ